VKTIQRKGWLLLGMAVLLTGLLLGGASAAAGMPLTAKDLKKVTLIHYAADERSFAKPGPVTPPPEPVNTYYELLGWRWATPEVPFVLDPDGGPAGAFSSVSAAFAAWDAATTADLFADVTVDAAAGPSLKSPDGVNTVSFRLLAGYPKALAITNIWYDDSTGDMVDDDVIFNAKYQWGVDQDGEGTSSTLPRSVYDVANVGTHELGHVVGLDDLYLSQYRELTMYGYAAAKETMKISLMPGDVAGAQAIYGR
jgi:hypothetical protein